MKKALFAMLLLVGLPVGLAAMSTWGGGEPAKAVPPAARASVPQEAIDRAKAALADETKIVGVYHDPEMAVQWHVGVHDDGTPRYGYAGYVCQVLAESGAAAPGTEVRIVDAAKVMRGETFRAASLGRVECATGRREMP